MKFATFNINNINRRLPNLLAWLRQSQPDVVCIQELKAAQDDFPAEALGKAGYHSVWNGQKTWNGVAILSRDFEPIVVRRGLPGDKTDTQSRYIEAAVKGILVGCIYLPNGNPQPGPKFDYKLAWFDRLQTHAKQLLKSRQPVILAGDYNVAPTEIDIYPTKSWDNDALIHPKSRAAFAKILEQGWTDSLRAIYREERIYTFWQYWRNSWPRNAGLRIDHILLSPQIAKRLKDAGVDRFVRGTAGASDHAPVWVFVDTGGARQSGGSNLSTVDALKSKIKGRADGLRMLRNRGRKSTTKSRRSES